MMLLVVRALPQSRRWHSTSMEMSTRRTNPGSLLA